MKLTYLFLALVLFTFELSCKKVDNYSAPDAGITGTVIDNTTNEGIQTEAGSGFQIGMLEFGYNPVIPINFFAKADGSFENTQLFADKYKVIPFNGAFLPPDTAVVDVVKGLTNIDFTVTPFMTITAAAPQVISNNVVINYTLSRPSQISYNITTCMAVAAKVPAVSASVNDYNINHDLSGMNYQQISQMQFSDTLKNMPSGTIYVRIAGQTSNPQNRFNYSKVDTVNIP